MTITDYDSLQSAIADYLQRNSILSDGKVEEFIQLAEARLNRELETVLSTVSLTGVDDNRFIDVSAYSIDAPISMFQITEESGDVQIPIRTYGTFSYNDYKIYPSFVSYDDSNKRLAFDALLSSDYTFRFIFEERFALSESVTTNTLLTENPDVYLLAAIVWGALRFRNSPMKQEMQAELRKALAGTKRQLGKRREGKLIPDPALQQKYRSGYNDGQYNIYG